LEDAIKGDTSGDFERFLVSLLSCGRQENTIVDEDLAKQDAENLKEAGPDKWGTDEAAMNQIFCLRSPAQLAETFRQYEALTDTTIDQMIADEIGGDLREGFQALIDLVRGEHQFWAKRIRKCVDCVGTHDDHLIRIIVSRSEIDMEEIAAAYEAMYEQELTGVIDGECGGHYKKLLIALITKKVE